MNLRPQEKGNGSDGRDGGGRGWVEIERFIAPGTAVSRFALCLMKRAAGNGYTAASLTVYHLFSHPGPTSLYILIHRRYGVFVRSRILRRNHIMHLIS